VVDIAGLNQLLQVVGDIRAEIVAAAGQLSRRQFGVADVVQEQRLHAVHVGTAQAFELILDDVEKQSMQTLNELQGHQIAALEIFWLLCTGTSPYSQDHCHTPTLNSCCYSRT
jgi:hypothetical protein